jgi:hypothetical protein
MRKLTVVTEFGTVSRRTAANYTHVVVNTQSGAAVSWHRSLELVTKSLVELAQSERNNGVEVAVVEVATGQTSFRRTIRVCLTHRVDIRDSAGVWLAYRSYGDKASAERTARRYRSHLIPARVVAL